jgi:hypothetical protein
MSTRRKLFPFWFPLLFGLMGVSRIFGNPRLAAIRTVDLVQLIAIGMCFGVALTTLVTFLRRPRDRQV